MANKKFYYHGKNTNRTENNSAENTQAVKKQLQNKKGGQNAAKQQKPQSAPARYPKEKLAITLSELGINENLSALLGKNKIANAGDLVRRTEKDMFRIQGFNKKMLFELRDALKAKGMEFVPEAKPVQKPAETADNQQAADQRKRQKFATAENGTKAAEQPRAQRDRQAPQRDRKERDEKPKKLTEPLPVEEWRKIQKSGKWGFYDGLKTVIPAMYDEVFCFKDGLASVELEEKCGYINPANEIIIPFEYETAMSFSEGYASVVKDGKCGYINKQNEVIIPFIYDAATPFEDGEAKVKKDGKWGTILPDGSVKWI